MTAITTRAGKGSPLTNAEVDANFTNLNAGKLEVSGGTISANAATAALTITQSGTGNALVVEDSTSPDGTPFVIDSNGAVAIGTGTAPGYNLRLAKNATGASTTYNVINEPIVQSDVTNANYGFLSYISTQAANFNLGNLYHYVASQNTIGAGSSVTYQAGFMATAMLVGATNNYGFYGNIPAGTGRYNFYANGTADNYFAGKLTVAGGLISTSGSIGLGYGAGAGGSVVQATSKSTAVTLNKPCGQITMNAAALAAGATVQFTVNNSLVAFTDVPFILSNWSGGYSARVLAVMSGSFVVALKNETAGSLSDAVIINFAIIKGSTT